MPNYISAYLKLHKASLLIGVLLTVVYFVFAYHLERTEFIKLLFLFSLAFFLTYKLIEFEKWNFKFLLFAGLVCRLIFLIAEPNLSQDYFRFIWDGQLVYHMLNPYLHVPNTLIEQPELIIANAQQLHEGMGNLSARNFSNYPPLNQLLFGLSALIGGKDIGITIVAMRSIIICADLGILYFGRKLLKSINRSPHMMFWYFLNPLVLIELTGNLHFEGVMLFFFIFSLYLIATGKWQWGAVVYACSISIKLIPLLFLPLFLKYFKAKKAILFYLVIGVVSLVLFIPFYSPYFLENYLGTVGLWFSNFRFNAGFYSIVEQIAIWKDAKPWEFIVSYGKISPYITIITVLLFTFLRKNEKISVLIGSMLWVLTLYYFIATTVHPWYIIFLVALSVFTEYRFALAWSALIILSYFAYSNVDFKENGWLLALEYIAVFSFLIYEFASQRNKT